MNRMDDPLHLDDVDSEDLRAEARRVAEGEWSPARARASAANSAAVEQWWATMVETGWAAVVVPSQHRGGGAGLGTAALMVYELGRVLAPDWYLAAAVAAAALRELDGPAAAAALDQLATGRSRPAIALGGPDGRPPEPAGMRAERHGDGWMLSGRSGWALGLVDADAAIVVAGDPPGSRLFLVDLTAEGVGIEPRPTLDRTRSIADLVLEGVVVTDDQAVPVAGAADRILDVAAVMTAADAMGAAARTLELTVAHATARIQFDRPIGSFQAVKHRLADMHLLVEGGRAVVEAAATGLDTGADPRAASIAKAHGGDAAARVTQDAVQLHGGIGFTWEHDCHLFLKRARLDQALFGDSRWHRDRLGRMLSSRFTRS